MKSYFAYFVRNEVIENARKVFGKRVEPLPDSPWLLCAFLPEDWEATLFGSDSLDRYLENERQRLKDAGLGDDVAAMEVEIRQLWDLKQIAVGKTLPFCDGTVALLVEESYGISRLNTVNATINSRE